MLDSIYSVFSVEGFVFLLGFLIKMQNAEPSWRVKYLKALSVS